MSCEANFTGSQRERNQTSAIVDFEIDFEIARDNLEAAIADIVGVDADAEDDVLVKEENGSISLDADELRDLLDRLAEAPRATTVAFEDFRWSVARALRALRRALAHETAP
jgi:hypothetical protein